MHKEIILTGKWGMGRVTLVDNDDYAWLSKHPCRLTKNGYVATSVLADGDYRYREITIHRLIMERHHFHLGSRCIDHINGDRLDNRKANLRLTDYQGNARNAKSTSPRKTSRYKGVSCHGNTYSVGIMIDGVRLHLGVYSPEEDAAAVHDIKARELFGEFARTNNIPITSEDEIRLRRLMNDSRLRNGYISRYRYVTPSGKTGWRARVNHVHLGTFRTQEEAAQAAKVYRGFS